MNTSSLVEKLQKRGITLRLENERLTYNATKPIPPGIALTIKVNKQELRKHLKAKPTAERHSEPEDQTPEFTPLEHCENALALVREVHPDFNSRYREHFLLPAQDDLTALRVHYIALTRYAAARKHDPHASWGAILEEVWRQHGFSDPQELSQAKFASARELERRN